MVRRRTHLRPFALIGVLLLLLGGGADAVSGRTCVHHAFGSHGHIPSGQESDAPAGAGHHGHGGGEHAASHADGEAPASPTHHSEGCGFTCLAVAGVSSVHVQPATDVRVPLSVQTRLWSPKAYDGSPRTSSLPFFLPYSNGPPSLP